MWKFWSAWHGFVRANSPAQPGKLTEAQKDELWADIEAIDAPIGLLSTQTYSWDGRRFAVMGLVKFQAQ